MRHIKKFFELSFVIALKEFKEKNEGSFLGPLWYLLNPLLSFLLLLAIFSKRLGNEIPYYPLYLLLGVILYNFFNDIATHTTKTIRVNSVIIKSVRFPKQSLAAAIVLKALFSHLIEIGILLVCMLIYHVSLLNLLFYPLIIIFFCVFSFGVALLFSCISVYFYDFDNIWAFVSRLLWIATPLFYAVNKTDLLFKLNLFNPLYYFISVSRDLVVYARLPELWALSGVVCYPLLFLFIGLKVFGRLEGSFADKV